MTNPVLIQKLSKILNWGQMKADVAIPAIERIINNYAYVITEVYGIDLTDPELEKCFEKDIVTIPADCLFSYLIISSVNDLDKDEDIAMFKSLRREIENEMIVHHLSYQEAIKEWFKWHSRKRILETYFVTKDKADYDHAMSLKQLEVKPMTQEEAK